ncbi:ABC transporter permease [Bifidobacterium sp.]|jgi:peptide/nickel transport system permease protein|uniref:ABC transporter permease n=1 Tax=Bifidobacterium sp. TaxID=41200 RepID=UPI0025BF2FE7|nr:ABC transporter permease [Bifidobacterium sp.]MCH4209336.1 ABC transporter permease [Bifidobacterium sp.]MCI1224130.1 ABC transporter permease [Bifidobacterium sp.]
MSEQTASSPAIAFDPRRSRTGFFTVLWRVLKRKPSRMFGAIIVVVYIAFALFGNLLYRHMPPDDSDNLFGVMSLAHPLGTDFQGADVLALLVTGTQYVLLSAAIASIITVIIGVTIGLYAGFRRGFTDSLLMRITDIILTIPNFPLLLVLSIVWKFGSPWTMGVVLGITGWGGLARAVRAQTMSLANRGFIEAAHSFGFPTAYIVFKELLPNMAPFVAMNLLMGVTNSIYSQVGLFYLGVLPFTSSNWGVMIQLAVNNGVTLTGVGLPYLLSPLIAILLLTLGVVLLVDALDEVFNPRLRENS